MAPWTRALAASILVAMVLACGGAPTGEVVAPPVGAPAVFDEVIAQADAEAGAEEPTPPTHEAVIAAYAQDCHHVFPAAVGADWPGDNPQDECLWFEMDQNCSPDPSGCWNKGQECAAGCGTTCASCQESCAGTCDTCKATCGGDAACLAGCAESRAACRDGCVGGKATCADTTCPAGYQACDAAFEVLKAEKCPNCEELRSCEAERESQADADPEACHKQFPDAPPECWEWCSPDY